MRQFALAVKHAANNIRIQLNQREIIYYTEYTESEGLPILLNLG